jgi:hypothetical protein
MIRKPEAADLDTIFRIVMAVFPDGEVCTF